MRFFMEVEALGVYGGKCGFAVVAIISIASLKLQANPR